MTVPIYVQWPYIIISIHIYICIYIYNGHIYILYIITWSAMQRLWTELGMLRNLLHHAGVILQSMLCNILHDNGKPELLWHRVRRNLVLPGVNEYQPLQGDIEMTSDDEKMPPPFHMLRVQIWPPVERVSGPDRNQKWFHLECGPDARPPTQGPRPKAPKQVQPRFPKSSLLQDVGI